MNGIFISVIAVGLAALSLGWNIYRDLVSKTSRVKVFGMIAEIVSLGDKFGPEGSPKKIVISAVNHGPTDTTLSGFSLKKKTRLFGKPKFLIVLHDYTNPVSDQLPCELKVGKKAQFIFSFNSGCLLKMDLSHIGISDVLGRTHWMKARNVKKLRSGWCEEFQTRA